MSRKIQVKPYNVKQKSSPKGKLLLKPLFKETEQSVIVSCAVYAEHHIKAPNTQPNRNSPQSHKIKTKRKAHELALVPTEERSGLARLWNAAAGKRLGASVLHVLRAYGGIVGAVEGCVDLVSVTWDLRGLNSEVRSQKGEKNSCEAIFCSSQKQPKSLSNPQWVTS